MPGGSRIICRRATYPYGGELKMEYFLLF